MSTPRVALVALLLLVAAPFGAAFAQDVEEPWAEAFRLAREAMRDGDPEGARDVFAEILGDYQQVDVRDRATAGIASSFLQERRYQDAIESLADGVHAGGDDFTQSRQLYTALERRIRRARNRARSDVVALQEDYDDISWWNVFRIFEKLGKRKDLKDAEKDLEELEDLYQSFEPALLLPVTMPAVAAEEDGVADTSSGQGTATTSAAADTSGASAGSSTTTTATDSGAGTQSSKPEDEGASSEAASEDTSAAAAPESATEADPEAATETETASVAASEASSPAADPAAITRSTARDILASEIQALLALIPEDRLAEADAILDGTATAGSVEPLEATTAAASADASASTTAEAATEEPGEAAATPTEGTLELLGGSPASPGDAGTAEVEPAPAPPVTADTVTQPQGLRDQYYAAYRRLQEALTGGDQEAIRVAREDYLTSVNSLRGVRQQATNNAAGLPAGPAAPASGTTSATAAAPATAAPPQPPAPSVNATTGSFVRDRTGTQRGLSDGVLRQSRTSFQR